RGPRLALHGRDEHDVRPARPLPHQRDRQLRQAGAHARADRGDRGPDGVGRGALRRAARAHRRALRLRGDELPGRAPAPLPRGWDAAAHGGGAAARALARRGHKEGTMSRQAFGTARLTLRRAAALAICGLAAGCGGGPGAPEAPGAAGGPPAVAREFRGVWVATVGNIDWPSTRGLAVDSQKAELLAIIDRAAELKLNAVIFQVRTAADALYPSELEPWSEYLTGTQGRAPEPFWDPLTFAVEAAHARGLELHAWFNPYRARHPSARSPASSDHISVTRPDIVRRYGTHLWMDPGEP